MKKRKAKVFAVLMTVMMLIGSVNFSYAAQPENGNGGVLLTLQ